MNSIKLKGSEKFTKYDSGYITNSQYTTHALKDILIRTSNDMRISYGFSGISNNITLYEMPADEIYDIFIDLNRRIITPKTLPIKAKDKIFFADSKFPSLLLSRLNVDVKRTTKADDANVIVSDCTLSYNDIYQTFRLIDPDKKVITNVYIDYKDTKATFIAKVNLIISQMNKLFGVNLKLYARITESNFDTYEIYQKHSTKFIRTEDFIKYIIPQLPKLNQTECDKVCYMLKSQDEETVSLALSTLVYHNIFDNGIDILSALINSKCLELPSNRDSNYIYLLLGQQLSTIKSARHYSVRSKLSFYMNAINKFLIIPSMSVKEKVIACLRRDLYNVIVNNYKEELNRLNVTLKFETNDEDGETNNSSSEVEGI